LPDVAARLKPFRPKTPRKLTVPLKVGPRSPRYQLVGTAFDSLLRFECQRRAPHAVAGPWVTESAPDVLHWKSGSASVVLDLLADAGPGLYLPPEEVVRRVRRLLTAARGAVATYAGARVPTPGDRAEVAGHALRLAKLDSVCHVRKLEPGFRRPTPRSRRARTPRST